MSQQALREAFSEAELLAAKKKHQQVQEHMQVGPVSGGPHIWNMNLVFKHTDGVLKINNKY